MPDTTPLFLLHPFPADASFWDRFRASLRTDRPSVTPNAPGFGGTDTLPGWTIAACADRLAGVIARHTPCGRGHVMGLSMGGYTALALAIRHPERVAGLILADTRAGADDAAARAARGAAIVAVQAGRRTDYLGSLMPNLLTDAAADAVRDELAACVGRQPDAGLVDALTALAGRPDRRGELTTIARPTLVIVGSEDRITPLAAARELADGIPNARIAEIPGAGHLSALEQPERVAVVVDGFLDTVATPA
jgi:pimeloyl-ACP methyl ester carboxylesterase